MKKPVIQSVDFAEEWIVPRYAIDMYAVPKGKSLNPYTQEDMTLLMNHINSVKRPGLGNKSPYELVEEDDEDFKALMSLLKMHLIPPDEVHLMPDLFVKK